MLAEASVERKCADRGARRQGLHVERLVQMVLDPFEERMQGAPIHDIGTRLDELRLAAGTFERSDREPRGACGDLGATVAPDEVQATVKRSGGDSRTQRSSVVDVEHVRVDIDGRMAAGQLVGARPVCGGASAVEKAGRGKREGPVHTDTSRASRAYLTS